METIQNTEDAVQRILELETSYPKHKNKLKRFADYVSLIGTINFDQTICVEDARNALLDKVITESPLPNTIKQEMVAKARTLGPQKKERGKSSLSSSPAYEFSFKYKYPSGYNRLKKTIDKYREKEENKSHRNELSRLANMIQGILSLAPEEYSHLSCTERVVCIGSIVHKSSELFWGTRAHENTAPSSVAGSGADEVELRLLLADIENIARSITLIEDRAWIEKKSQESARLHELILYLLCFISELQGKYNLSQMKQWQNISRLLECMFCHKEEESNRHLQGEDRDDFDAVVKWNHKFSLNKSKTRQQNFEIEGGFTGTGGSDRISYTTNILKMLDKSESEDLSFSPADSEIPQEILKAFARTFQELKNDVGGEKAVQLVRGNIDKLLTGSAIRKLLATERIAAEEVEAWGQERNREYEEKDRERRIEEEWLELLRSAMNPEIISSEYLGGNIGEILDRVTDEEVAFLVTRKSQKLGIISKSNNVRHDADSAVSSQELARNRTILDERRRFLITRRKKVLAVFNPAPKI